MGYEKEKIEINTNSSSGAIWERMIDRWSTPLLRSIAIIITTAWYLHGIKFDVPIEQWLNPATIITSWPVFFIIFGLGFWGATTIWGRRHKLLVSLLLIPPLLSGFPSNYLPELPLRLFTAAICVIAVVKLNRYFDMLGIVAERVLRNFVHRTVSRYMTYGENCDYETLSIELDSIATDPSLYSTEMQLWLEFVSSFKRIEAFLAKDF